MLIAAGCNLVIADDGLQHYALARDVEICVIDGVRRFGQLDSAPPTQSPSRLLPHGGYAVMRSDWGREADQIVVAHKPSDMLTASFRSLAAAENVFAIESLVDELAAARGEEPLDLRLRNIADPRLRGVLEAVAERSGWRERPQGDGHGYGLACTLYAHGTYVAEVAEVTVAANGRIALGRFWCAVDPGRVIDENGVRNQCEGAIVQSASWTLI